MQDRFQFRHVHTFTGTFVLIAFAVVVTALIFTGRSQRWFIGNESLGVVLPETGASGIRPGSEVYFLGTLMGTVSDVRVDPNGRMEAQVSIRSDFYMFVRADSYAVVKRKFGLVGDSYFEITRGEGLPLPKKNAYIKCREELSSGLESAVQEVRNAAVPALQKLSAGLETWTVLGSNMISTRERLDQLITRADGVMGDLQKGKGTAGILLNDPGLAEEMKSILQNANRAVEKLQVTLTNLQMTSVNLAAASTNLPPVSSALAKEAEDLPGLVLQTQASLREVERLSEALQRHWLIRKYVNPTNPPSSRVPFK
ncbi:MAG: hypothetical protein JWM04_427 [Verrucomicrobiales bacterium]|nr:hypothetical protein [Verrucomicrobiales bacterium]